MPEPIVIGRVEDPEQLNLDVPEITLVGYTLEREEIAETFRFRPVPPTGAALDVMRSSNAEGNIPLSVLLRYVDDCLLEADQEPFQAFLHRADVMIESDALVELYRSLTEYYAGRPTQRPSGSASTGSPTRPTSRAAARSAASRSKTKRS